MIEQRDYIEEEQLSFGYLVRRLKSWINFLLSKWLLVLIGTLIIASLIIAYNFLKTPTNYAKTSFVLETSEGGTGLGGGISSIASIAGFNLQDLASSASPLFQIDNIQSLYRSRRMLEKTLLDEASFNGENERLIKRFAKSSKLDKKWEKVGVSLDQFDFPREDFSRAQDSLLIEVIELIQENHLQVAKQSRKVTILEVGFSHKDELLAINFNERHVNNVNQFYTETKTKKTSLNLETLQKQTDSVKRVLDESLLRLASIDEKISNPNPIYKTAQVPYQQAMIDVQANSG
ncbi:MAG TPA: exopolysaccharide biosynthesis protein, partial [Roseivirga sp.]